MSIVLADEQMRTIALLKTDVTTNQKVADKLDISLESVVSRLNEMRGHRVADVLSCEQVSALLRCKLYCSANPLTGDTVACLPDLMGTFMWSWH